MVAGGRYGLQQVLKSSTSPEFVRTCAAMPPWTGVGRLARCGLGCGGNQHLFADDY